MKIVGSPGRHLAQYIRNTSRGGAHFTHSACDLMAPFSSDVPSGPTLKRELTLRGNAERNPYKLAGFVRLESQK